MDDRTPREDGFRMPPEWTTHQCTYMAWPTRVRRVFWADLFEQAKQDYATVARAIAAFEPVQMICCPGDARDVRDHCGGDIDVVEIEIDDSWARDSGPIFVTNDRGEVAVVDFTFNSWGGKYRPFESDAALASVLADLLGARCYHAPLVLEGGAFYVDGDGTVITTEGPLLDPRRNPGITKERVERALRDFLGAERVVWLVAAPDRDTDGHVDGIAQYLRPGAIVLLTPRTPGHPNFETARENLQRLATARDARGRPLKVLGFEPTGYGVAGGQTVEIPYLNCYLANGAVVAPVAGSADDEAALERLREVFPDRTVVGVPGATLSQGGGGPHCITQQMPLGVVAAP